MHNQVKQKKEEKIVKDFFSELLQSWKYYIFMMQNPFFGINKTLTMH